jgi:hypothetical protein
MTNTIQDFTLSFGKFKGQLFLTTPKSYQQWLTQQQWFKLPIEKPLHKQLVGWDGYGRKGEAIYDGIFEEEKQMALRDMCLQGICSCCVDSKYYGM